MTVGEPRQSIRARLEDFYRRLGLLPSASSAAAAFEQLCQTLDAVEDELSGVVKQSPPPFRVSDGRMYFPSEDHIIRNPDGGILAMARGHRIEIGADGSIRIVNKVTLQVEFEK
jgi:hypothetical protein